MSTAPQTILLVEDEVLIALAEKQTLQRAGYNVVHVTSGEAAVEVGISRSTIDLILMDINLGSGMSGTEAAEAILAERDVPITFLSSHTSPEIVNKTEGITGYGYIVKGTGDTVLLASVKMALRLHWSEQRFAQVLSHVREVSIQGYTSEGVTNYWNRASERVYGYSADEAIGRKLWELIIPPEMSDSVQRDVQTMLTTGEPNPPETISLLRKDGSRVLVRSNHVISTDVNGRPELFCVDIPLEDHVSSESPKH